MKKRKIQARWLTLHLSQFEHTAKELFENDLNNRANNRYVTTPTFQAYIRSYSRDGHRILQIARVVVDEKYEGQGVFSAIINQAKQLNPPFSRLELQSVLNEILTDWCKRHGWQQVRNRTPPSFTLDLIADKTAPS